MRLLSILGILSCCTPAVADVGTPRPRLVFLGISTTKGSSSTLAHRLRRYTRMGLIGCNVQPRPGRRHMNGSVEIRGTLDAAARLQQVQCSGTFEHRALASCIKPRVARWILGDSSTASGIGRLGTGRRYERYQSTATLGTVTTSGSLQQSVVTWALQRQGLESSIRYCHSSSAKQNATIQGKLKLSLRVGKNGGVEKVELVSNTINDLQLQGCVMRYMVSYSSYRTATPFPASTGTTDVTVELSFPRTTKVTY